MRRIVAVLVVTSLALGVPTAASAFTDLDCGDFGTQPEAQAVFAETPGDPHRLDYDGDGIACETFPGIASAPIITGTTHAVSTGKVVAVIDGDTIDVRVSGVVHRIRIVGIDTPEVHNGVECGGAKASAALTRMLHPGARVRLRVDPTQDAVDVYDRWLRYVSFGGKDVGRAMVAKGWAAVYVYGDNPFQRTAGYVRAAAGAESRSGGVWRICGGF